jgi:hypothetical protein
MKAAGPRGVSVQLAAQVAKGWARLGHNRNMEVALDRGRRTLENLPQPTNPDHHFVIDPAKWHFYQMDAYRAAGNDALAFIYAEEVLRNGIAETGEERKPHAQRRNPRHTRSRLRPATATSRTLRRTARRRSSARDAHCPVS